MYSEIRMDGWMDGWERRKMEWNVVSKGYTAFMVLFSPFGDRFEIFQYAKLKTKTMDSLTLRGEWEHLWLGSGCESGRNHYGPVNSEMRPCLSLFHVDLLPLDIHDSQERGEGENSSKHLKTFRLVCTSLGVDRSLTTYWWRSCSSRDRRDLRHETRGLSMPGAHACASSWPRVEKPIH